MIFTSLIKGVVPLRIFRRWIIGSLIFLAGGLVFLTICVCLMLMTNTAPTPPVPLEYKVIEFSTCTGWNNTGTAEKQQIFQSDDKGISVCGRLQTNRPIALSVDWYYEGQRIYSDVILDVETHFLSELTPTEKEFPVGNYVLQLVIGRKIAGRAEFQVVTP